MEIQIVNSVDKKQWSDFVLKHPDGNPFQMPWMYEFFQSVNGYIPLCFFAINQNKEIKGCMHALIQMEGSGLKAKLSSRAIISGGPLINFDEPDSLEIFVLLLKTMLKKVSGQTIYIEFRNFFNLEKKYIDVLNSLKFQFEEHLNFIVHLNETENPIYKLNESKRRQVRKAIDKGAEIIIADNITQIRDYYEILVDLYKYRAKKPLADWTFFKNFFEINCQRKEGIYLLIRKDNKIIGGIMCMMHYKTLFEWYVCGLDREYKDLYPSVMATWASIKYAKDNGFEYFDFLGAGNPNEKYGVRDFKSKFGGITTNYGRYIRINKPLIFNLGKSMVSIYSRFFN